MKGVLTVAAVLLLLPLRAATEPPLNNPSLAPPPAVTAPPGSPPAYADRAGDGLSDGLQAKLAEARPGVRFEVIVTFSGPGDAVSAQAAVGRFTVHREFGLIRGFSATMTAAQARALAAVPGVFRVEEDLTMSTQSGSTRPRSTQPGRGPR